MSHTRTTLERPLSIMIPQVPEGNCEFASLLGLCSCFRLLKTAQLHRTSVRLRVWLHVWLLVWLRVFADIPIRLYIGVAFVFCPHRTGPYYTVLYYHEAMNRIPSHRLSNSGGCHQVRRFISQRNTPPWHTDLLGRLAGLHR